MGLVQTTPPAAGTTPLSLAEAKQQLALAPSESGHDQLVTRLVAAATEQAEQWTGRALLTQTWRLTLDRFPLGEIRLPRPPLQSITTVQYIDEDGATQTLDESLYQVTSDAEPARLAPAYGESWPATRCQPEAVLVTYVAGYGAAGSAVPAPIRHAIHMLVGHWFANRQAVGSEASDEVPLGVAHLLNSWRTGAGHDWYHLAE